MIGRIELSVVSASSPGQGGQLLPYGTDGLAFKAGNESTEMQEEYYAYLNQYVKDHNIPGIYFENSEDMLKTFDRLAEDLQHLIQECIYIEAGTPVLGEISESNSVEIQLDDPPVTKKKRKA